MSLFIANVSLNIVLIALNSSVDKLLSGEGVDFPKLVPAITVSFLSKA